MSSPAQLAANLANAQHSTGPHTPEGKAASSQNATPDSQTGPQALSPHNDRRQTETPGRGLFSTRDFVRPGEETLYAELCESVTRELAPVGQLESTLATEIRRAMWRLRRCGETEAAMLEQCVAAVNGTDAPIPDPLQIEAIAKLQFAVDRSRAQCHRLLHKCTAELRKLQTERNFRVASGEPALNTAYLGLTDVWANMKNVRELLAPKQKREAYDAMFGPDPLEFTETKQTHGVGRNSRCNCGSGLKYKRCCALKVAA